MNVAAPPPFRRPELKGEPKGFALLELLVVAVIIAILLALLLPALSTSKARAQGLYCMKNLKQLQMAWAMYADDHQDHLPGVLMGSTPGSGVWVSGWLDFSSSPDNTNTLYLTDRRFSQLAFYDVPAACYRCPADRSLVSIGGSLHPRVRSVSMNCWMNYIGSIPIGQDRYKVFRRITEITEPPPQRAWVFMDEREDSINDGLFQTDLKARGKVARIVDYPASYHNRAAGLSFADGHVQIKRWLDKRTTPELRPSQPIPLGVLSPDNPDVAWLQEHSSSPLAE